MNKSILEGSWQLWVQDNFDREMPRLVEASGVGLEEGLVELWIRHLYETVQENGFEGFSHFNLSLVGAGRSIEVKGDWQGQVRLRGWVFGRGTSQEERNQERADKGLLRKIAKAHRTLVLGGETSERVLAAVVEARSREEFEEWLGKDNLNIP